MTSRSPASRIPLPASHSCGFTLSEVILALVLLSCGAMALAAASGAAVRTVALAEAQERATIAARDRVERLSSRGCASLASGSSVDSTRGLRERWIVTAVRNGVRLITDSIEHLDRGRPRPLVLHRLVVC
jgi:prepilin-type N-terminal cleavage/methylation domain-containing protein